jgi:hypothetical protein
MVSVPTLMSAQLPAAHDVQNLGQHYIMVSRLYRRSSDQQDASKPMEIWESI